MYAGTNYSPADEVESEVFGLNFVNDLNLNDGEIITSITGGAFTIAVASTSPGTDPAPTSHLIGSAAIVVPEGATTMIAVVQRISGLLPNVIYVIGAVVGTNLGNTKQLFTYLNGEEPT